MPPASATLPRSFTGARPAAPPRRRSRRPAAAVPAEARGRDATAEALLWALDLSDPITARHCRAVAGLAGVIGDALGLGPGALRDLRRAALVHDVGKAAVPTALLHKRAPLNPAEQHVLRGHAEEGERMLRLSGLDREAHWVRHHHERPDGRGYPDGLAGGEVPLQSRIILVADAFDAMTADRSYRRGRPAEAALAELRRHAGAQFDLRCVEALENALERAAAGARAGRFAAAPLPTAARHEA